MVNESVRQRLAALNRAPIPESAAGPPDAARTPVLAPTPAPADAVAAPAWSIASGVVEQTELGEHLVLTQPLESLWPGGQQLVDGRCEVLRSPDRPAPSHADMAAVVAAAPDRLLLLDLETCGLAGAALFLVGLLRSDGDQMAVELLFARSYAEEPAVLATLWRRVAGADLLVTFNGKSFDWPMVMDRSRRHLLHKQRRLTEPRHVDALHHARRKWKGTLPDCRLQTLERMVCRRARGADIPGGQIPAAYDAFVRTGRDHELRSIFHHNAMDLVTLLDITLRMAG